MFEILFLMQALTLGDDFQCLLPVQLSGYITYVRSGLLCEMGKNGTPTLTVLRRFESPNQCKVLNTVTQYIGSAQWMSASSLFTITV